MKNILYYIFGFLIVLHVTIVSGTPGENGNTLNDKHSHDEKANPSNISVDKQHEHRPNVFQVLVEQIQKLPEKFGLNQEEVQKLSKNPDLNKVLGKEVPVAELEKLKMQQGRAAPPTIVPSRIRAAEEDDDTDDDDDQFIHLPHEEDENDRKARALGLEFGNKNSVDDPLFQSVRLCGYSPRTAPSRLSNVAPAQFPWTGAILDDQNRFLCAGTLISESIVLTTATCILMHPTGQPLKVRLGAWSLPDGYEFHPELDVYVRAAVLHPSHNHKGNAHDVGLLRLVGNIDFDLNPHIFPICVVGPTDEAVVSINRCLITGWPELPEMEPWRSRTFLSWGPVSVSRSSCPANTPNSCASGQACVANRGSPLICLAGSQRYYVWGLAADHIKCPKGSSVPNVPIISVIDNYDFIQRYLNTPNPNTLID